MPSEMPSARDGRSGVCADRADDACHDVQSASDVYRRVLQKVRRFARADDSLLLQGESGTGKTRIAALIHSLSPRVSRPFHVVNLAAVDENLASSELFGHVRGAYTGADASRKGAFVTAHGGTILLDECGKASIAIQGKLLRVMETRRVRPVGADVEVRADTRIIFAASEPLEDLVASGRMLRDFLPRLGMFRIVIPPLRERREDIPGLVTYLVAVHAPQRGYSPSALPTVLPEMLATLAAYEWPDNVRELESCIKRMLIDAEGAPRLGLNLLVDDMVKFHPKRRRYVTLGDRQQDIEVALERTGGNKAAAARELGIARSSVNRHLRKPANGAAGSRRGVGPSSEPDGECPTSKRGTPEAPE